MLGDAFLNLAVNQTTGLIVPLAVTGTTVSANAIDLLANKDIACGSELHMVVNTDVAPTAAASAPTVNIATGVLTQASHGLPTGTPVVLSSLGTVTGLTVGQVYYVVSLTSSTYGLATSLANALAGTYTASYGGANSAVAVQPQATVDFQIIVADDVALTTNVQVIGSSTPLPVRSSFVVTLTADPTNTVTLQAHGFGVGTPVQLNAGTSLPTALQQTGSTAASQANSPIFFVTAVTANTFKLATSYANALAGVAVTFTGAAVGTVTVTIADKMLSTGANFGPQLIVELEPRFVGLPISQRYLGARVVPNCPLATGSFTMKFSSDPGDAIWGLGTRCYPSGWSV